MLTSLSGTCSVGLSTPPCTGSSARLRDALHQIWHVLIALGLQARELKSACNCHTETTAVGMRTLSPNPCAAGTNTRRLPPGNATQVIPRSRLTVIRPQAADSAKQRGNACHCDESSDDAHGVAWRGPPAFMVKSASSAPGLRPPVSGCRPVMTTSGLPVLLVSAISSPFALSLRSDAFKISSL